MGKLATVKNQTELRSESRRVGTNMRIIFHQLPTDCLLSDFWLWIFELWINVRSFSATIRFSFRVFKDILMNWSESPLKFVQSLTSILSWANWAQTWRAERKCGNLISTKGVVLGKSFTSGICSKVLKNSFIWSSKNSLVFS